jgi:hypothetical protein
VNTLLSLDSWSPPHTVEGNNINSDSAREKIRNGTQVGMSHTQRREEQK